MTELAEAKGYRLVETTLYNGFFVRADLWPLFAPHLPMGGEGLMIDHLHHPTMTTDLWQLYEGPPLFVNSDVVCEHRTSAHAHATCMSME
jgi:hypothetical protein